MKFVGVITAVAGATAVVITDAGNDQVTIERKTPPTNEPWWGDSGSNVPFNGYMDAIERYVEDAGEVIGHTMDSALQGIETMGKAIGRELGSMMDGVDEESRRRRRNRHGRGGRPQEEDNDRTIWEMIKNSRYTTKFAKLIDEYPDVKDRLRDRKNDYTLFVPTDRAFKDIEDETGKRPSREFLEEILEYHIVPGKYNAGRIMSTHTLPTALQLRDLGNHHQRLRCSVGLLGLYINFYSKVVASNINACNGYIHAVDRILVPPPRQGRLINALPGKFSTFSLAMEKTGLGEHLHRKPQRGGTVFAPTNYAFMKLGPRMNEFLFSADGEEYLKAMLKYHVVANETLYSDAYYDEPCRRGDDDRRDRRGREREASEKFPGGNYHVRMRTELGEKTVAVEIRRWLGLVSMNINGYCRVSVQDGISQDGVVHVVESVLMPPKHDRPDEDNPDDDYENDNMSIDELKRRLDRYVDNRSRSHRHKYDEEDL